MNGVSSHASATPSDRFALQMALLISRLDVVLEVVTHRLGGSDFSLEHNYSGFSRFNGFY